MITDNQLIFQELGLQVKPRLLGVGVNAEVYEYGEAEVLKIFKHADFSYVERLKDFYDRISKFDLPYGIPFIDKVGQASDGKVYSIEKRIEGKEMKDILQDKSEDVRKMAIQNYISATKFIGDIKMDGEKFGELNTGEKKLNADSWHEYLRLKIEKTMEVAKVTLMIDIPKIDLIVEKFYEEIKELHYDGKKSLVHGDYYPPNVLFGSDGKVNAVIDFSDLTCVGDRRMDLASSLLFLESSNLLNSDELKMAYGFAKDEYGDEAFSTIAFYKKYYALLFSGCKETDPETFSWVVSSLNN